MDLQLIQEIKQLNPWLMSDKKTIIDKKSVIHREQLECLVDPEWDNLWTILVGPRRSGKTTLAKYLSQVLIESKRFSKLLYLNCDYHSIREWLNSPLFIEEAFTQFSLENPIIFIDEVQRIQNPGLIMKAVIDLGLKAKYIASGSSQLEIKSNVEEYLTGRQITSTLLPLSFDEIKQSNAIPFLESSFIYGSYPQVYLSHKKTMLLESIYKAYIQKDIIELLKIGKSDSFQNLITLLAHQTGQLININQLATDCKISTTLIRKFLDILEKTYVVAKVKPFAKNKRSEITKNPIYYFIDNGFRNIALRNFSPSNNRSDLGFLIENYIFQELLKFIENHYLDIDIHYWRTKSGAEVDFIFYQNESFFIPIEVKYRNLKKASIPRSLRSFIDAYEPQLAIMITQSFIDKVTVNKTTIHFIPVSMFDDALALIKQSLNNL